MEPIFFAISSFIKFHLQEPRTWTHRSLPPGTNYPHSDLDIRPRYEACAFRSKSFLQFRCEHSDQMIEKSLFINVARLQAGPPRQTGHLHHAENVPEGKAIAVDMAAGSVSVKRQPLRAVDKCTHTPGPGDQLRPCDILERIAHMRHFPVENRA